MNTQKYSKGFSLVELLVVVAIITVITAVVVFNYRKYESVSIVEQTAQELDLAIRTAQVSASSGREFKELTRCNGFSIAYGVNVAKGGNSYRYFAEQPGLPPDDPTDCDPTALSYRYIYLPSDDDTKLVGTFNLKPGFIIEDILVSTDGGTFSSLDSPLDQINIGFGSGRLYATIRSDLQGGPVYAGAQIVLKTPQGDYRYITTLVTGVSFITESEYSGPPIESSPGGGGEGNGEEDAKGGVGEELPVEELGGGFGAD